MQIFNARSHSWLSRRVALALLVLGFVAGGGRTALAHQDPPGCSGTAVDFSFMAFRAGGAPIDLSETVTECEAITYQVTVGKSSLGNPCAFEGGTITITTPDGVVHNVTPGGGVPCIGGTGACSATQASSNTITYTVNPVDVIAGQVIAGASYTAAFSHTGVGHTLGFPKASTTLPLDVEFCAADTDCIDNFCDPLLYNSASGALGNCTFDNVPDSTPCTDIDGNQCTFAGCNGSGTCDQNHQVTICPPDSLECTNDPPCNPGTGLCAHPNKPDSTPCGDSDSNLCTSAGCETGTCVQGHQVVVCNPDTNECTNDPPCNPGTGLCTHPAVPDSTPCTDSDAQACTIAGCDAGVCSQSHIDNCQTLDHFQCYELKREAFTGPTVKIDDVFGTRNAPVQRPERICNPADKNDEDNAAPTHDDHLTGYKVRYAYTKQLNQLVVDQFGNHRLDIKGPDRLMVPTAKSMVGPPSPLVGTPVDHLTCYKVGRPRYTPAFIPVGPVKIDDQFGTVNLTLKKPFRLCVPADKNDETPGADGHADALLCYKAAKVPPFGPADPTILNQFGTRVVEILRRTEFCVPAQLNPAATTTTTTPPSTTSTSSMVTTTSTSTSTSTSTTVYTSPSRAFAETIRDLLD